MYCTAPCTTNNVTSMEEWVSPPCQVCLGDGGSGGGSGGGGDVTDCPECPSNELGTIIAANANFGDVMTQLALPNWARFPVSTVMGDMSVDGLGHLVPGDSLTAPLYIQLSAWVLHNWGKTIYFGVSIDDGPVQQFASHVVESNVLTHINKNVKLDVDASAIGYMDIWYSSDFEYADTVVQDAYILIAHPVPAE